MARLFGTDGVRGLANKHITVDLALKLAQATAVVLGQDARSIGNKPKAVLARDPRISGEFLSAAVAAGLASSGVDVYDAGVLPTPGAAFLTADIDADFGVMISASHNSAPDNGIKIFARGGHKLEDHIEDAIEAQMSLPMLAPLGGAVGHVHRFADGEDRYIVHLLGSIPNRLEGLTVVLDCAHGAASGVSPEVFKDAGAKVIACILRQGNQRYRQGNARALGWFCRPSRVEQHHYRGRKVIRACRVVNSRMVWRQVRSRFALWHSRARDGRNLERYFTARKHTCFRWNLLDLQRLHASGRSPRSPNGRAINLRLDPRLSGPW